MRLGVVGVDADVERGRVERDARVGRCDGARAFGRIALHELVDARRLFPDLLRRVCRRSRSDCRQGRRPRAHRPQPAAGAAQRHARAGGQRPRDQRSCVTRMLRVLRLQPARSDNVYKRRVSSPTRGLRWFGWPRTNVDGDQGCLVARDKGRPQPTSSVDRRSDQTSGDRSPMRRARRSGGISAHRSRRDRLRAATAGRARRPA